MNTRMNFSFYNPTRILFGAGELNKPAQADNARQESLAFDFKW